MTNTLIPTPTLPLTLSVRPTVTPCTPLTINWSGGVLPWIIKWQLSTGTIGDESAFSGPPRQLFIADDPGRAWFPNFNPDQSECHSSYR
jgi:hypothetical protein